MAEEKNEHKQEQMQDEIDLRELLGVLKKRSKVIILVVLVCVLTSGVLSFFVLNPVYEAESKLLVTMASNNQNVVTNEGDLESVISSVSRMPQMTINTYVEQLNSEALMQRVIDRLNLNDTLTPGGLLSMTEVRAVEESNIVEVKVRHTDRDFAVQLTNALNEEYLEFISDKNHEQMNRSMEFLDQQKEEYTTRLEEARQELEETDSGYGQSGYEVDELQERIENLREINNLLERKSVETQIARSIDLGNTSVVVVSPAMNATQVKPNAKLNVAVSLVLGLMVGVGLAFVMEFLDNTIKDEEDVEKQLGLPVIGKIPDRDKLK